ncbi:hypothetical protein N9361_04815 [Alphaproteobacteria bacterium]|nr:hypothetical protein [Alphaproteobacteria bacterium]MDB0013695.1 hypothetical protein [Alphaproteobacteria bacterium]MDB3896615.1 hypothetical protein [Alphaproteobacteria bacterium]
MNILTKLGFGACVVFGVLSGGYYLTDLRANEAARLAVEAFKKDFEASVPSSTVDIGTVKATIFDQEATVKDFSIRIGESVKLSSQAIVLALKDGEIYSGEFRDIRFKGYLNKNENIDGAADSLIINDIDVAQIKSITESIMANPKSVPNQIDRLAFAQIKIDDLRFDLFHKGEPKLALKPSSFDLVGVKNSQIEKLSMAGEVEVSKNEFAQDRARFQLGNLTLNKFDFSKIVTPFVYDSEQDLMVGLRDGFGLNDLQISDLRFSDGENEAYLSSGKVTVSKEKIADIEVKGFVVEDASETTTVSIGAASLRTLDLTMLDASVLTVKGRAKAISTYLGVTEFMLKDAFVQSADTGQKRTGVMGITLDDISRHDGLVTTVNLNIEKFIVPVDLIAQENQNFALIAKEITGSDEVMLSFKMENNYDVGRSTYDTVLGMDVTAFGDLMLKISLEDVPFEKLKALSNAKDPLDTLTTLGELNEAVSFKEVSINYVDGMLADKILEQAPPASQLNAIIRQQLNLFLISYPAEREQILDAVAGFLEGKNGFSIVLVASTPIPVKDLLEKFTSGQINRDLTVTAIGR